MLDAISLNRANGIVTITNRLTGAIIVTGDPADTAAPARRLEVSGKPDQYDDLAVFVREQEEFRSVAGDSSIPGLEIDMTAGDLASACARVADWMEANDLLGMP